MSERAKRNRLAALGAVAVLVGTERAAAIDAWVDADFEGQFYTVASPFGQPVVRRRRYTQSVALEVLDLNNDPNPLGPDLRFSGRLRIDTDLGIAPEELNTERLDRFSPGLERSPFDLMHAYVEARNYAEGLLTFRLGRQYVVDPLGYWSFDGALGRVTTPAFFALDLYGGFERRDIVPAMATSQFSGDGVLRGDRSGLELDEYPEFLDQSKLAPAYGFTLSSAGLRWLDTRLSYRKVINRDTVLTTPFPDASGAFTELRGDRTSTERIGYALRATGARLGTAGGQVVYDLYVQRVSRVDASLEWFATDAFSVGTSVDYYLPTFDGDSIFNWFSHRGATTWVGLARWSPTRHWALGARGGARLLETAGDPESNATNATDREPVEIAEPLGDLDVTYGWFDGRIAAVGRAQTSERGHAVGGDLDVRQSFLRELYDANVVLSIDDWADALRPTRDATSFTYVLGGGVRVFPTTRVGAEWEHSMNRLVGQRFRALATLRVRVR